MSKQPLSGVVVLELGQVIAGTFGGLILADLGADVIKVEPPRGDLGRNGDVAPLNGESAVHLTMNRGKRSVAIDLKSQGGLDVFRDLARHADVVIDNFRPGVLERLGVDYDNLSQVNGRLVTCSLTGFGRHGSREPSFDLIHQALTGHMSITGEENGPPTRLGVPLADLGVAMFGAIGILAALQNRDRTGQGSRVDVSMYDSMTFLLGYEATLYLNSGQIPRRWGSGHASQVPWQAFKTSDGWIVVATREETFWQNFCHAIGRDRLAADASFASNADRVANREALLSMLEATLIERPTAEWLKTFALHEVPAAPVRDVGAALDDSVDGVIEVPLADAGSLRMLTAPYGLDGKRAHASLPPPRLGEHTREVLTDIAGYSASRIAQLESAGAVLTT